MNTNFLSAEDYAFVVRHAPLPAIDLVVQRPDGAVLLGLRRNRPAAGWWFMPGGRIRKDETLQVAYARNTRDELGVDVPWSDARFLGVVEHFYPDNFRDAEFGTHCIALVYLLKRDQDFTLGPYRQHAMFRWWHGSEWTTSQEVHLYTKEALRLLQGPGSARAGVRNASS